MDVQEFGYSISFSSIFVLGGGGGTGKISYRS